MPMGLGQRCPAQNLPHLGQNWVYQKKHDVGTGFINGPTVSRLSNGLVSEPFNKHVE